MTETVYFSLGSNVGDREGYITEAIRRMDSAFGVRYSKLSEIIETPAWGFDSDPFLNCAVMYRIDSDPYEVLDICKAIERELGREEGPLHDSEGNRIYRPRTIDIDILLYGDRIIRSSRLTIPHPLIAERDFVKIPLGAIAGEDIKIQQLICGISSKND